MYQVFTAVKMTSSQCLCFELRHYSVPLFYISLVRLNNGIHFHTREEDISQNNAMERPITCQSNPFCIQLSEVSQSSLKGGLSIHLSSLCRGNLNVFWGPEIKAVFNTIAQATDIFLTDLEQGKHLQDKCLYSECVTSLECDKSEDIYIQCPTEMEESQLGSAPRKRYSCILIAAVPSSFQHYSSDIIASLVIIHLKDSLVGMGSHIMKQFVKTGDGRVYSLRSLYLARNEDNSAHDSSSESRNQNNGVNTDIDGRQSSSSNEKNPGYSSINPLSGESHEVIDSDCTTSCDNVTNSSTEHEDVTSCDNVTNSSTEHEDVTTASSVEELSEISHNPLDETVTISNFPECIICQTRPQSHALLPCRHACVCHICFKQLTRCPMCRAPIESYFRLSNSVPDDLEVSEQPVPVDFVSWIVQLNTRLNEYLGFT